MRWEKLKTIFVITTLTLIFLGMLVPQAAIALQPGDYDYCSSTNRCSAGYGDCDSDSECQSGLVCVDDVGTDYGWAWDVDVCQYSTATPTPSVQPGDYDYCSSSNRCYSGYGDCDSDSECRSGLVCVDDVGADYGWEWDVDVCQYSTATPTPTSTPGLQPGDYNYCSSSNRCSAGYGDCDSDSECKSGLVCADDVGSNYGWASDVDVCQYSTATPTPTSTPGLQPGDYDYCSYSNRCYEGYGDCDSDSDCRSGLVCVDDVGPNYGWASDVDVCESPSSTPNLDILIPLALLLIIGIAFASRRRKKGATPSEAKPPTPSLTTKLGLKSKLDQELVEYVQTRIDEIESEGTETDLKEVNNLLQTAKEEKSNEMLIKADKLLEEKEQEHEQRKAIQTEIDDIQEQTAGLKGKDADVYVEDIQDLTSEAKERLSKEPLGKARKLIEERDGLIDRRKELMSEFESVSHRVSSLAGRVADGEISDETFRAAKEEFEIRKVEIQDELGDIDYKLYKEEYEKPVF